RESAAGSISKGQFAGRGRFRFTHRLRAAGPTSELDEFQAKPTLQGDFRGDVKHTRGIVSMARADDPDSASTSFFLMLGDAPHLDTKYSAFGRVIEGMDVLDAFDKEEVDGETPKRRVEIIEASIDPA